MEESRFVIFQHLLSVQILANLATQNISPDMANIFQMLHVKVAEARGLLARDGLLGRSDPYIKLDLTGRYALVLHRTPWRGYEALQT